MDIRLFIVVAGMCIVLSTGVKCEPDDKLTTVGEKEGLYMRSLKPLVIPMFTTKTYNVNVTLPCQHIGQWYGVSAVSANTEVFRIHGNHTFVFRCSLLRNVTINDPVLAYKIRTNGPGTTKSEDKNNVIDKGVIEDEIVLTLEGKLLGISNLELHIHILADEDTKVTFNNKVHRSISTTPTKHHYVHPNNDDVILDDVTSEHMQKLQVLVLRVMRPVDRIFMIIVPVFIFMVTVGFGCKLDLGIVKECVKKPIAPGIGLSCQYIIMPLIGFSVAKLVPDIDAGIALGIFVCGICPGGGVSNIYTYLLDGDVSLSITMTFLSTVASIVMMPLWLYTLGTLFITDQFHVSIPWTNLIQIIALVTVPLFVGIFLKYKFLKAALFIIKVLKPLTICAILVLMVFAFYSNWYIFKLFTPLHILAGCLLPYLGYMFGGVIATLFRLPAPRIKAILLETGMQNVGVAYLLMVTSLPPPHGDLASVAPMASAVMTPVPPFIVTIIYILYKKCCKKYQPLDVDNEEITVKADEYYDDDYLSKLPEKLDTAQRETIL